MNAFDGTILSYLNSFAGTSWSVDYLLNFIAEFNVLKGLVPITMLWLFWFNQEKNNTETKSLSVRKSY